MKMVVIGGHSRNIGKTSLMCGIISASPELGWTALKITQFGHGICSTSGHECGCAIDEPEHLFAITRESDAAGSSDTSRYLAAGASEVYWVRTPVGQLEEAIPAVRNLLGGRRYVIVESNSILRFVKPDLYLPVLQYDVEDFKLSSRLYLSRADAYVITRSEKERPSWRGVDFSALREKPQFEVEAPDYFSGAVLSFVLQNLKVEATPAR